MFAWLLTITTPVAALPLQPLPIALEQLEEPSDEEICDQFTSLAAEVTKELPKMTDAQTRTDGFGVVCALKLITTSKYVTLATSEMRDDWQAIKQAQWNQLNCVDQPRTRRLIDRGWQIELVLSFRSGERNALRAHCS